MAAILCKIYRYAPTQAGDTTATGIATRFAADLAADGIIDSKLQAFEKSVIRGEVIYTVLHIA